MSRWSQCPGSVRLSQGIESRSSSYAEEGTRAHAVAEQVLKGNGYPPDTDPEMQEAVQVYIDTVDGDWNGNCLLEVECRFNLDNIHKGLFGTSDAVIYDKKEKLLRVYDYKHGQGIAVEVPNNPQLLYYGLGALLSLGYPCKEVELVIVQPRCPHPDGPVRRWRIPAVELVDFAADLVQYAKATEAPDAPLKPGDWCRFCPAAASCPALKQLAQEQARQEFRPELSYDPVKLAEALHHLPILEAYIKATREFAYGEAEHGRTPPGWKLVAKRATRKWIDEENVVSVLKAKIELATDDDLFDRKLKSPAMIEKIVGKAKAGWLSGLVVAESSGYTLAPDSDKRDPVKKSAKEEFDALTA